MSGSSSADRTPGTTVEEFVLRSDLLELRIIPLGAIVKSLVMPDCQGRRASVVLGHDDSAAYQPNPHYLGAVVGRYANRIAHARFHLGDDTIQLATNDGAHHLHGGIEGFDQRLWTAPDSTPHAVTFTYVSPPGEEHYPGTLHSSVTYALSADNIVEIRYEATTDAATPVNLTQHSYFNLSGARGSSVLDHELSIAAEAFHPVDATLIPEGPAMAVAGTPFDFREPRPLLAQLRQPHEQLRRAGGFDHNWLLRQGDGSPRDDRQLSRAARLRHPASGRVLDIATTEPGLQFYSGQLLGSRPGDAGRFVPHGGLCLESQHFPDSPNHPDFPSTILRPGERYRSSTTWTFSLECD